MYIWSAAGLTRLQPSQSRGRALRSRRGYAHTSSNIIACVCSRATAASQVASALLPALPPTPRAPPLPPPTPRALDDAGRRPPTNRPRMPFGVKQQLPASVLPPAAHIRHTQPVRLDKDKDEFTAVWDEATETWQITVFPALRPSGREQVGQRSGVWKGPLRAAGLEECGAAFGARPSVCPGASRFSTAPQAPARLPQSDAAGGAGAASRQGRRRLGWRRHG